MLRIAMTIAVLSVFMFPSTDKGELLKQKASQLRRLREKYEMERNRLLKEIRSLKQEKRHLSEVKEKMLEEVAENERRITLLKKECVSLRQEERTLRERSEKLSELLDSAVVAIRRRIEGGIPYLLDERLKRCEAVERGDLRERLDALSDIYAKEMRFVRSWEAYRDFVNHPDGRKLRGYILRVGLIMLAFLADGGETAFLIREDGTWKWRFISDVAVYHSLNEIVRQVRRTTIPDVVRLPLPVEFVRR